MQKGLNKWLEREEGSDDKKKKNTRPGEKTEEATKCFLVSSGGWAFVWNENSECLRDYSGLAGPWEPSSYLYTRNMEYGNHRRVCVCVCSIMKWQFKQTHNVVNQKKRLFLVWPHLPLLLMKYPQNLIFLFFTLSFLPSHWVTSLSLFFLPLPPLPPPLHPYVSPLRSFIPATRAEKPRRHAPSVLRGSNFRFVSDFRLMSVFWLVV